MMGDVEMSGRIADELRGEEVIPVYEYQGCRVV